MNTLRLPLRSISYLTVLFLAVLLPAACAQGSAEITPPEIRYGEDLCAHCNMIISEPRFAAGYAHELAPGRYESLAFDDIGDMLEAAKAHPDHTVVAWYVHDYAGEDWIDATTAYYVVSKAIITPMGFGIAAHSSQEAAAAQAAEVQGEVLTWEELQAHDTAHEMH
ncbi:MAG: nitrous oxide reductase accessory protein NosL [Caldilineaceae bacterium]|nr:nitrous oxide reductase accessory protein NosL [Caldilineaceae bacterium]